MPCFTVPVRTHIFKEGDDIVQLACRYTAGIAGPGDIIALAESAVAITQRRAILPETVKPGLWAHLISRFPAKHGSLATPPAMQLAIQEVGLPRILLGCLAAAIGKLLGRKGYFYLVAGRKLALIDDIAGTMWPYEKHIILGPREPEKIVSAISKTSGREAVIADVNDIKCVDILAASSPKSARIAQQALIDNPFGNDDQQTPIVVIKEECSNPQVARITNVWSKVRSLPDRSVSCVVIESVPACRYELIPNEPKEIILLLKDAVPNLFCETIPVHDGLVEEIAVQPESNAGLAVRVTLTDGAPFEIVREEGIPARIYLNLDRSPLAKVFGGRVIILDPGHGGSDFGEKGPVDLLEKNVVLTMAERLKAKLAEAGAQVFLTRSGDQQVSPEERFDLAKKKKAHLFLSLHTHYHEDDAVGGLVVNFNPVHPGSLPLAQIIAAELAGKIKRNVLEIAADHKLSLLGNIPGLVIKPVTISNWVEEGLLRNPTLYDKIATAILNGLRKYFSVAKDR
ncbi:MAG: N-acetylmuramoyl-L-alanine amidase [Bacillota bacterium]